MTSHLFYQIVFGPVHSRRFGVSLGINLLPIDAKICSFDCVYCECGWTDNTRVDSLPKVADVKKALETKLKLMAIKGELPDVITFSGNGEPTMHPHFDQIIEEVIALRNKHAKAADIVVLSNSTQLDKEKIRTALQKIDKAVLKLDSTDEKQFQLINKAAAGIFVKDIIANLLAFEGKCSLQTLFLRGKQKDELIDNTNSESLDALIDIVKKLKPVEWMIYPIDRPTPADDLEKIGREEMNKIAAYIKSKIDTPLKISY